MNKGINNIAHRLSKIEAVKNMSRANRILTGVLILQLILLVGVFFPRNAATASPSGPLLENFTVEDITELVIRDTSETIRIIKNEDDEWALADADGYPVNGEKVEEILRDIVNLQTNRLIARNTSSHNRLKVAEDNFERALDLISGDQSRTLYIGTSAGANATHMRLSDRPDVYLTGGLAAWEVPTQISSWINTLYFSAAQPDIIELTIENENGMFEFEKVDEQWVYSGIGANEEFDPDSINAALSRAANLRMTRPLSRSAQEAWSMENPRAKITLLTRTEEPVEDKTGESADLSADESAETEPAVNIVEKTYVIEIGAELENGNYVAKTSESDYYVEVASSSASAFLNLAHDDLLAVNEESAEQPGDS